MWHETAATILRGIRASATAYRIYGKPKHNINHEWREVYPLSTGPEGGQ